jgi:hypothetical protein
VKRLLGLAGAVAALILIVGAPAAYAANTLYVDAATGVDGPTCGAQGSPCQTIQQAVDNASSGDTIMVAAGTYGERVQIGEPLTLEGAQAGNPGSHARLLSPASESVVTGMYVLSGGDNVTIDGFMFNSDGNQVCLSCDSDPAPSFVTIENNVFSGYDNNFDTNDAIGVNGGGDSGENIGGDQVLHNYFNSPNVDYDDFGGAVVQWFNGGCSDSVVSDNVFDNADASALADVYFYCDDKSVSTITVSGNTDTIGGSSSFVNFQHIGGTSAEIDLTNNRVTMTPASGSSGFYFSSSESGVHTVNIVGNTMIGDPFRALKLSTNAGIEGPVTVTGNDFSNAGVAVYVGGGSLGPGGTLTLRANNLANASGDDVPDPAAGVLNLSGVPVDAADNWWGCNAGPGNGGCSAVVAENGAVAADTWLVLQLSASSSFVPLGGSTTLTADLTRDNLGADVSGSGTVLNGTTIAFATDHGTLSAASAETTAGKASVTISSPTAVAAHPYVTLDNQSAGTTVDFAPADATQSTLAPASSALPANGSATRVLIVQAKDSHGDDLSAGGATVTITKHSGVGTIGSVTDNGNGTYTATVTAPSSPGTGVFVATLNGRPVMGGGRTQTLVTVNFVGPPTITTFDPQSGGKGTTVTVTGTNFTGTTRVRLNGTSVPFTVASDTTLRFTVPAGATAGTISIDGLDGSVTSTDTFAPAAPPTITSFTPGNGSVGTVVTITGTNLANTVGVQIGRIITVPTSVSATQVTFTIPAGAVTGSITILSKDGSVTATGTFTVT